MVATGMRGRRALTEEREGRVETGLAVEMAWVSGLGVGREGGLKNAGSERLEVRVTPHQAEKTEDEGDEKVEGDGNNGEAIEHCQTTVSRR
jgi:hypothetical protein